MAGIYIHIPFCKQKCSYCDFHFSTTFSSYRQNMLECMLLEIDLRKNEIQEEIETIYFGGGTPSLLNAEELNQFIQQIEKLHSVSKNVEVTLEANPDDITKESVSSWVKIGINRLSIGIQSFDDEDLRWMNRAHSSSESLLAVELAKEQGINNISIDLIYGLPNMDLKRWEKQIDFAIQLDVKHISAYCLTVEEKTVLHKLVKRKKIHPVNNEMQSLHFELLQEKLNKKKFIHYEVSNFGKENFFSKHNSSYWKGKSYQGIGPSAHSYNSTSRSWNVSNNNIYMQSLRKNILALDSELLSLKDLFNETLLIGLRTMWGVSLSKLDALIKLSNEFHFKVNQLLAEKNAKLVDNNLILTPKGLHCADAITMDLFITEDPKFD
jgi:oxygen-independent coproporphyrinogen-3 oxidase